MLDKVLWKNIKTKQDGEIEKHKLNEMGALDMKYKKWNKLDKRSSYRPVVFKYDCSLETIWSSREKTTQYLGICIFQKISR